jgi:hypothetical protein
MKGKSPLVASALIAMLALGIGCSRKPDDSKISSDIQSKFSQDSGLASKQISVQSNNGVVTLSGAVDDDSQRDVAGRDAASVPGVKEVVNNLTVGNAPAPAPTETAAATPPEQAPPAEEQKPTPEKEKKSRRSHHEKSAMDANSSGSPDNSSANQMAAGTPPPAPINVPAPATQPAPPPPPKKFIIDQGTQLTVRLVDPIDSEKNQTGDTFHATLNAPLTSDGQEAVPAGVDVTGHLVDVKSAGKFKGQSEVVLQLDSITSGGQTYNIQTDQYKKEGSSRGKNTAEKVGGGALIGGIIGALAGGGKGAAIGAAAGAGVGGGVQAATKGQQIKLPSETVLNFTLQAPVTVVQARSSARTRLGNSQ